MESAVRNLGGGKRAASGRSAASTAPIGRPRPGYTLIEVLLSLTLASLVLLAVGMAVDFQLRVVDRSRGNVEEAQLARVLLRRIADDLRCAVTKDPLQMAELVKEFESAAAQAAEGAETVAGESTEGAADSEGGAKEGADSGGSEPGESAEEKSDESEGAEDSKSEGTGDSAESATPQATPGVYGESDRLQVDVGILPRLDQFDSLYTSTEGSTTVDRISDVKTVTYYVVESEDETGYAADGTPSGGLVRRELDRAASLWASGQGQIDDDSDVTPIAPEVSAIAFRYWDGTEWVDSWDSGEAGALPVAVEVTLTIRPIRDPSEVTATTQSVDEEGEEVSLTYSRIIHLLAADASSGDETSEGTEESGEASETTETTESGSTESGSAGEESAR
ncbi:MAG TPA: type II secretion system protein GspJ [Thermoguttaceae bacterium]|nr:type II secretion system protein GspJ [Thermoguttaceae bacterium]